MSIGKSVKRVDAYDKVTGRAKYTDDLCDRNALIIKLLHSTIAHGIVKSMDTSKAEAIPGVVKVITCFDVPDIPFPTAGHPWSTDPSHQDVADRKILNRHVRYYGDEIAIVVAEDEVAAKQGVAAIEVEYIEYPFVLDAREAMQDNAPVIHDEMIMDCEEEKGLFPTTVKLVKEQDSCSNILAHTNKDRGDFEEAIKEPGLIKVEGWYKTPIVQHTHIENHVCYAEEDAGKIKVVSSTQIPHIVRRVVAQALGLPWGKIRIIKPYIGGGFGNKQDALYEPLVAYVSQQLGGRLVKFDVTREETFVNNRVRHSIEYHIVSYVREDGSFAARKFEAFSNQGAYASHGHSVNAKGQGAFPQHYPCDVIQSDAYTVYTNTPAAGAMRGYGIPQVTWAEECHMDEIARVLGRDPLEYRNQVVMKKGYADGFSKNELYHDSYIETHEMGKKAIDYDAKMKEYANQTGNIRRGVGMASFWYNTGVWPISLESSSSRLVMNQDGSVQLQIGETEIGQGADTAYAQMVSTTLGVPMEKVHVISTQDTDVTPFGTGAYASRQTYAAGFSIRQTTEMLKKKVLDYAQEWTRMPAYNLDIIDGNIVRTTDGRVLLSLEELATEALYSLDHSEHFSAESTYQIKSNAYSFGCTFAEVEVDIALCKVKLLRLINVHDCGDLINPALAEGQVHGGMSMAIGYGLSEELLFDEKTGRPLNDNLLDYKISSFEDHPDLEALFVENTEPTSAYGTKALGEPPTCSGAPAIRNAIFNATGVGVQNNPVTPKRLFEAFREAGLFEEVDQ